MASSAASYVVVKNFKNSYYVVHSNWLSYDENGSVICYFPPEKILKKALSTGMAPANNWEVEAVETKSESLGLFFVFKLIINIK